MNAAIFLLTASWIAGDIPGEPEIISPPANTRGTPLAPGATIPPAPGVPGGSPVLPPGMPGVHGPVGPPMDQYHGNGYHGCNMYFTQRDCWLCRWASIFQGRCGSLLCQLCFWRRPSCSSCCQTCGCGDFGSNTGMPPLVDHGNPTPPTTSTRLMPVMVGERNAAAVPPRPLALASFTQKEATTSGMSGKMVVALPAGANLFVDGQPVRARAGETTFRTPLLGDEEVYYYDLRAELERDGQTICESTRVVVRPGKEAWVSFPRLEMASAAKATNR